MIRAALPKDDREHGVDVVQAPTSVGIDLSCQGLDLAVSVETDPVVKEVLVPLAKHPHVVLPKDIFSSTLLSQNLHCSIWSPTNTF